MCTGYIICFLQILLNPFLLKIHFIKAHKREEPAALYTQALMLRTWNHIHAQFLPVTFRSRDRKSLKEGSADWIRYWSEASLDTQNPQKSNCCKFISHLARNILLKESEVLTHTEFYQGVGKLHTVLFVSVTEISYRFDILCSEKNETHAYTWT